MAKTKTAIEAPAEAADPETAAPAIDGNGHGDLVRLVGIDEIVESGENPRKTFLKIEELAEDIRRRGILQPILLRGNAGTINGRYELVFGARRLRAARKAGLARLPAMIRDMSDREALELRIIENSQREDVHPLEEAEGYEALHKTHGLTVDEIAAKTGRSKSWVYQRMKLLALCPEACKAFYAGEIDASVAVLIARIPSPALQVKALMDVGGGKHGAPMKYKRAMDHIQNHYMLRLNQAPFSRKDPDLVPAAGACLTCPKRTGCQPELFEDVKSADVCTDSDCYGRKVLAHSRARAAEMSAAGAVVVEGKAAKRIFPYEYSREPSAFVALDSTCWDDPKTRTYRKILNGSDVPITAVINPHTGLLHELISAPDAASALRKVGVQVGGRSGASPSEKAAKLKARIESRAIRIMIERLVERAKSKPADIDYWRAIAFGVVRGQWHDTVRAVASRRGLVPEKKPKGHYGHNYSDYILATIPDMDHSEIRALLIELIATRERCGRGGVGRNKWSAFDAISSLYQVDFASCEPQARAELLKPTKSTKKPPSRGTKAKPGAAATKPRPGTKRGKGGKGTAPKTATGIITPEGPRE